VRKADYVSQPHGPEILMDIPPIVGDLKSREGGREGERPRVSCLCILKATEVTKVRPKKMIPPSLPPSLPPSFPPSPPY
jgi:hypothetical protein